MTYADTPYVKVLTEVHRCGKSTMLKMIMEKLHSECGVPTENIKYSEGQDMTIHDYR